MNNQHEENEKKKKGIALKASSSIQDESDKEDSIEIDEDDDLSLFIKRFNKFLRVRGNQRRSNFKSRKTLIASSISVEGPNAFTYLFSHSIAYIYCFFD